MLALRRLQTAFSQAVLSYARPVSSAPVLRGLEEFFDKPVKEGETPQAAGRSWKAVELRTKSFDDLHKLWFVLLKERNMLQSEKLRAKAEGRKIDDPMRLSKVRKSMARIKLVLSERAHAEPTRRKQEELKRIINAM